MSIARQIPLSYALAWPWWYARAHAFPLPALPPHRPTRIESGDVVLGFLGDLMGLGSKDLVLAPELSHFFADCGHVCVNLEGLTETSNYPILWRQTTRHFRALEELRRAFPAATLIAGLANNHVDDVTTLDLAKNLARLNQLGFVAIGTKRSPSFELAPGLRLHAATAWLGREPSAALAIDELDVTSAHQHLLFLHHGHEFHRGPRAATVATVEQLAPSVIGVVGHHTHFPQGLSVDERFVAWSLGNLAVKYGSRPVDWGLALKLVLRQVTGAWQIVGFEAAYLRNFRQGTAVHVCVELPQKRLKIG